MKGRTLLLWLLVIASTSMMGFMLLWNLTEIYGDVADPSTSQRKAAEESTLCSSGNEARLQTNQTQSQDEQHRTEQYIQDDTLQKTIEKYVEFHRESLRQSDISNLKFVVYVENLGGLGNHFLPMTSVLAYAILTNRIYLQYRVSVSGALISSMFDTAFETVELDDIAARLGTNSSAIMNNIDWCYNITIRHVFIQEHWEHIHCNLYADDTHQFIRIFANQYFMPVVVHNHRYIEKVKELFGQKFYEGDVDLYGPLSRVLFRPRPHLQTMIDTFKKKHFTEYVVGVQLREEFMNFPGWTQRWLDCIHKVIEMEKVTRNITKKPRIFMASDLNKERITNMWASEDIVTIDKLPGRSSESQIYAALDVFILSQTNLLLVTEHSTFGSSAAGFSSRPPYVMTREGECRRFIDSQPHCHFCEYVHRLSCFDPRIWYSAANSIEP